MRVDWCVSSWFRIKNTHSLVTRRRPTDGAGARRPKRNYGKNRTPPADERSRNWSAAPARGVRETGLEALFCEQGFPPGGGCGGQPAWKSPAPLLTTKALSTRI